MSVVVDSSIALAWVYDDESSAAAEGVLDLVIQAGGVVPALWRLEVANSLVHAARRGRINAAHVDQSLADLMSLDIAVDPETNLHAWSRTYGLAVRFGLTVYDAAYLELAQRRELPLASLDGDLRAAAKSLGVPLLGV